MRARDQKTIDNAIKLLETPGVWAQGNELCCREDRECAGTAIGMSAVSQASIDRVQKALENYIGGDIFTWNDAPGRTLPEVIATLRAVRELV